MKNGTAAHEVVEQHGPAVRRESGVHTRLGAFARELAAEHEQEEDLSLAGQEQQEDLSLVELIDSYEAAGYSVSVGAACALGVQLCDQLHRLHQGSEMRGMLRIHGRVSFASVRLSRAGEVTLTGLDEARPDSRGRGVDVYDAAVLVTELLGGQAAAQKLLPRALSGLLDQAIAGAHAGDRPVRAADLSRALATEAASPSELHAELRLSWPSARPPSRLPPPPRLPDFTRIPRLPAVACEPVEALESSEPKTIAARPSALR